jgi:hypothetical protein
MAARVVGGPVRLGFDDPNSARADGKFRPEQPSRRNQDVAREQIMKSERFQGW